MLPEATRTYSQEVHWRLFTSQRRLDFLRPKCSHTVGVVKLRFVVPGVLLIVFMAGLVLFLHPAPELVYEGQTLSVWLEGYDGGEPERQKADEIVLQAGTNAIPTLLRMLREQDSAFTLKFLALARKQHLVKIRCTLANDRYGEAGLAFAVLGARAKEAVPALISIYNQNRYQASRFATRNSLAAIGPAASVAVHSLMTGLTNENPSERAESAYALGMIHSWPQMAVPALSSALRDPDARVRGNAALSLGKFGADARAAVPELVRLLNDLPYPAMQATNALKRITSISKKGP